MPVEIRISLKPHTLRLHIVLLVLFVIPLHFARGNGHSPADLLPHDFLGDDLIADVGLKVLVGIALLPGRLFQILHARQVVLLADLVQLVDQFGFAINAEFLALGEPELLVNEVAEQVFMRLGKLLHGGAVLPALVVQFLHGAVVVGTRDDLVVYTGNDVFDDHPAVRAFGLGGTGLRRAGGDKENRAQHRNCGDAEESKSHRLARRKTISVSASSIDVIVNGWRAAGRTGAGSSIGPGKVQAGKRSLAVRSLSQVKLVVFTDNFGFSGYQRTLA